MNDLMKFTDVLSGRKYFYVRTIHLLHKSVNQNAVREFLLILNSLVRLEPGHCIFWKFSIGILTENFMNSEPSGILYCPTGAHVLLLVRFGFLASPHD